MFEPGFIYAALIKAPVENVWALYADVNTVNRISPFLTRVNFERVDLPLRAGAEIIFVGKYPPRMRWQARLEEFVADSHFIDIQIAGPFEYWRHAHIFKARGNATEMIDRVEFSLKGGRFWNRLVSPVLKLFFYFYFCYRHYRTETLVKS
jgi:ligand-binding SRPBCC domain-containing protein